MSELLGLAMGGSNDDTTGTPSQMNMEDLPKPPSEAPSIAPPDGNTSEHIPINWIIDYQHRATGDWMFGIGTQYSQNRGLVFVEVEDVHLRDWVSLDFQRLRLVECDDPNSEDLFNRIMDQNTFEVDWIVSFEDEDTATYVYLRANKYSRATNKVEVCEVIRLDNEPDGKDPMRYCGDYSLDDLRLVQCSGLGKELFNSVLRQTETQTEWTVDWWDEDIRHWVRGRAISYTSADNTLQLIIGNQRHAERRRVPLDHNIKLLKCGLKGWKLFQSLQNGQRKLGDSSYSKLRSMQLPSDQLLKEVSLLEDYYKCLKECLRALKEEKNDSYDWLFDVKSRFKEYEGGSTEQGQEVLQLVQKEAVKMREKGEREAQNIAGDVKQELLDRVDEFARTVTENSRDKNATEDDLENFYDDFQILKRVEYLSRRRKEALRDRDDLEHQMHIREAEYRNANVRNGIDRAHGMEPENIQVERKDSQTSIRSDDTTATDLTEQMTPQHHSTNAEHIEPLVEGQLTVRKTNLYQLRSTGTFKRKKIWKEVYIVMDGDLKIYKGNNMYALVHELSLEELTEVTTPAPTDEKDGFKFQILGTFLNLQLKTKTLEEAKGWQEAIEHNLRITHGEVGN